MAYTTPEQLDNAYTTLHNTFKTGKTKSLAWRKWQLKNMFWMVADNEEAIAKALNTDLNRHEFESYYADIEGVKKDILHTLAHVEEWAADEMPDAGFLFGTLGSARIRKEPLGVALIIGTWNFPFIVTLTPLVAAISAGCCAMVKPAETVVACQDLFAELIPKYLDQEAIRVVTGGPKEATMILERRFDHIFYTGSAKIAKFIAAAAAKHLTPTVLELGGQAPCIVTPSADIDTAAKRIVFSKYLNNGQICLAANHVFVDPSIHDKFVERAIHWLGQYLKDGSEEDAVRIVNEQNYDRLVGLLKQTDGKVVYGGKTNRDDKFIQQTLVTNVTMQGKPLYSMLLPLQQPYAFYHSTSYLGLQIFSLLDSRCFFNLAHLPHNARCKCYSDDECLHLSFLLSRYPVLFHNPHIPSYYVVRTTPKTHLLTLPQTHSSLPKFSAPFFPSWPCPTAKPAP